MFMLVCRPNGLADISLPAWHPTVVDRGTGKSIALRLVGPHVGCHLRNSALSFHNRECNVAVRLSPHSDYHNVVKQVLEGNAARTRILYMDSFLPTLHLLNSLLSYSDILPFLPDGPATYPCQSDILRNGKQVFDIIKSRKQHT